MKLQLIIFSLIFAAMILGCVQKTDLNVREIKPTTIKPIAKATEPAKNKTIETKLPQTKPNNELEQKPNDQPLSKESIIASQDPRFKEISKHFQLAVIQGWISIDFNNCKTMHNLIREISCIPGAKDSPITTLTSFLQKENPTQQLTDQIQLCQRVISVMFDCKALQDQGKYQCCNYTSEEETQQTCKKEKILPGCEDGSAYLKIDKPKFEKETGLKINGSEFIYIDYPLFNSTRIISDNAKKYFVSLLESQIFRMQNDGLTEKLDEDIINNEYKISNYNPDTMKDFKINTKFIGIITSTDFNPKKKTDLICLNPTCRQSGKDKVEILENFEAKTAIIETSNKITVCLVDKDAVQEAIETCKQAANN